MDQSESCFGGNSQSKRTLTVFTVGGNDVAKLTQVKGEASDEEVAAGYPEAWQVAQEAVVDLEESVKWLKVRKFSEWKLCRLRRHSNLPTEQAR